LLQTISILNKCCSLTYSKSPEKGLTGFKNVKQHCCNIANIANKDA